MNNQEYKRTPDGDPITMDIYYSDFGTGPFPVLMIVHGGGWRYGCKENVSEEAAGDNRATDKGFIAITVDFRMPCHADDPDIGDYEELCGWFSNTASTDVKDAVKWVRNNLNSQ